MRGTIVRTPERVAEAIRLREQGKTYKEIGLALGVSLKTAHEWVSDSDGKIRDARKASYQGKCLDCGTPTDGSRKSAPAKRCRRCRRAFVQNEAHWNEGTVANAIHYWIEIYGRAPSVCDWSPAHARGVGTPERAIRWESETCWPSYAIAENIFGTWGAALEAAGVGQNPTGHPSHGAWQAVA
jgi:hypothetical protein